MGKNKSKNNTYNKEKSSRSSFGNLNSMFADLGFQVPEEKQEEKTVNKYENYDPDKVQRKKRFDSRSQSNRNANSGSYRNWKQSGQKNYSGQEKQSNGGNSKIPVANLLPLKEGPYSPYNFVPFSEKVLVDSADARLNVISDVLYSGELRYKVTAQTPILVDSGESTFYRNKDEKYALPGSTMRGLIRSNLQILSFSGFKDDIDDYRLMYRAVAGGALKNQYGQILGERPNNNKMTVLTEVKAGYLRRTGDNYTLYYNKGDSDGTFSGDFSDRGTTNYYVVSERYVIEKAQESFQYILDKMNYKPETKFRRVERDGRVHYEGSHGNKDYNESYKPYFEKISYEVGNNGRISGIQKNGLKYNGYVISTGKMNEKKAFYVIPEIDEDHEVDVSDKQMREAVKAFQIDYNRKKNGLKDNNGNFNKFFELPEDGETRPVFYIELGGRLYFGYTPRLRLMFDHTILDGLSQKEEIITDFSKKMFGYTRQSGEAHKSRLFFTDAVITNLGIVLQPKNLLLEEPKPTSYLEYVCQNDGKPVKTYNDKDFRLRGAKQYWLQDNVNDGKASDKNNVKSSIKPLKEGCTFEGKIRFQNLTAQELGLLIWSVRLEKDSQMNVGKAKPYGYGRIKVNEVELYLQNQKSAYIPKLEGLSEVRMNLVSSEERDTFVDMYKIFLADWLKGERHSASSFSSYHAAVYTEEEQKWAQKVLLEETPALCDFFYMKTRITSGQMAQYMPFEKKSGFQNFTTFKQNNNPLPTIFDYRMYDSKAGNNEKGSRG